MSDVEARGRAIAKSRAQEKMERMQICEKAQEDLAWAKEELAILSEDTPNIVKNKDFVTASMRIKGFNQKVKSAFALITDRMRVFDWFEKFVERDDLIKILKFDDFNRPTYASGLYLSEVGGVTELPASLTVKGALDLRGTDIKKLPRNLTVTASLSIAGTAITELPEDLHCGVLCCSHRLKKVAEQAVSDGRIESKNIIYNG